MENLDQLHFHEGTATPLLQTAGLLASSSVTFSVLFQQASTFLPSKQCHADGPQSSLQKEIGRKKRRKRIHNKKQKRRDRNRAKNNRRDFDGYVENSLPVFSIKLPNVHRISGAADSIDSTQVSCVADIEIKSHPPIAPHANKQLREAKYLITPIAELWKSRVRQYLNDTQFVEIHRKGNSLQASKIHRSEIHYGQTVVDYTHPGQSKVFSRAYFKLLEILQTFQLGPSLKEHIYVACLAEGPGGFLQAFLDRLASKQYLHLSAITLRIDAATRSAKDWQEPRAAAYFTEKVEEGYDVHLSYGADGTGDLLNIDNLRQMCKQVGEKCQIVTGDGGIELLSEEEMQHQQLFNAKLFFAEIVGALMLQALEGCFILKIYSMTCTITKQLLGLLACHYGRVSIYKPMMSRPGNSEKYIICEHFLGIAAAELLHLQGILAQWRDLEPESDYFKNSAFVHSLFSTGQNAVAEKCQKVNNEFEREQVDSIRRGLQIGQEMESGCWTQKERFVEQLSASYSWCRHHKVPTNPLNINDPAHHFFA